MKERMVPLLIILAAIVALILNWRGQLVGAGSVSETIFQGDPPNTPVYARLGAFGLAFFGYLMVVSILSDTEAEWFTGILALGEIVEHAPRRPGRAVAV